MCSAGGCYDRGQAARDNPGVLGLSSISAVSLFSSALLPLLSRHPVVCLLFGDLMVERHAGSLPTILLNS